MNNFYFVLINFFNFYGLIKCSELKVIDLDYFAYIDKDKIKFECSFKEENINLYSQINFKKENKNICGIQLYSDGYYKLNLHLKNLSQNNPSPIFDYDYDKIYLDINYGENYIYTQLEYHDQKLQNNKLIIIIFKLENGRIFYSTIPMCKTNLDDLTECEFIPITNNTKLNNIIFDIQSPRDDNIILLQQKVKSNTVICKPPCVNGICHNSKCYCKNGFMGDDCSICKMILINIQI